MKKILYLIIISILFIPLFAYASVEVNNATDLKNSLDDGEDIKLTDNISVTTNIFVNTVSTIDLNGYTLNMTNKTLVSYKTLTIKDTSTTQTGTITSTAQNTIQVGGSTRTGEFILDSGKIDCRGTYCVNNYDQMTINGGYIEGSNYTIINRNNLVMNGGTVHSRNSIAIGLTEDTTFTMNDGFVETLGDNCAVFVSASGAVFTMNGGRIEALYEDSTDPSSGGLGVFTRGNTQVTINDGTILSNSTAIVGNGQYENTNIYINGGDIKSLNALGMYLPHRSGETVITGGTITGISGIEVRGSTLNITGGTINATSDEYKVDSNNNGSTTKGVAVAVVQHVTKQPISVHISGGTFNALVPFIQANTEGNPIEDINKITIVIDNEDGVPTFNSLDNNITVYSENFEGFIQGGKYSTDVGTYIAPKYGEIYENGMETVYKYNNIVIDDNTIDVSDAELRNSEVPIIPHPAEGYEVDQIIVTDENGNIIPVNNNKFIMPTSDVHIVITYKPIEETKGEDTTNPITGDIIKAYARILISSLIGILLVGINKQLLIDEM